MSKLKTFLLVIASSVISSLVTAAVVLYVDLKPETNVFAEAGDVAFYGAAKETGDEPVVVMTGKASFVSDAENVDELNVADDNTVLIEDETQANETEDKSEISDDNSNAEVEYYMLSGRDKYHKSDCYYIRGKENVVSVTMSEITEHGFEPCKKCLK